jgi:hypothetical protein
VTNEVNQISDVNGPATMVEEELETSLASSYKIFFPSTGD